MGHPLNGCPIWGVGDKKPGHRGRPGLKEPNYEFAPTVRTLDPVALVTPARDPEPTVPK